MSRVVRITASVMAIALLCCSLCGCQALDELRSKSGRLQSNSSIVMLDGVTYRLLTPGNDIHPLKTYTEFASIATAEQTDLPLLLYPMLAEEAHLLCSEDGTLLYEEYENRWFCREDVADELNAVLNDDTAFSKYCILPSWYNDEVTWLTENEVKAVEETLKQEPIYSSEYDEFMWIEIEKANEKFSLSKSTGFFIGVEDGKFFLYDFDNCRYTIPLSLYGTISKLYTRATDEDINSIMGEEYP